VSARRKAAGCGVLAPLLSVLLALSLAGPAFAETGNGSGRMQMQELDENMLRDEVAQAGSLILMDRVAPNELTGATSPGTYANFSYYRMGLDVKMDLNANLSKFQLGCGGVHDLLTMTPACDLDIDYLGFMGINAAGDRPDPAGAASAFKLTRPFFELAFKNENNPATRELVGIRIGAQNINGAIRMGRDYTNFGYADQTNTAGCITNQESGGNNCTSTATPATAGCNPAATTGMGVVGCHSGLNSISGYLAGLELSAGFKARLYWCLVFSCIPGLGYQEDVDGCLGRINFAPCTTNDTPFFVDAGGTRLSQLFVKAAKLRLNDVLIDGVQLEGYGGLILNSRQIHYLLTPNSPDFYISFQRERVSWPRYNKTTPAADFAALNPASTDPRYYDACNAAFAQMSSRCSSAYLPAANTGWWLSATNAKMLNLMPGDRIQVNTSSNPMNVTQLLAALGPENSPLNIDNPKLDFIAADNCRGTAQFC
jgi:hypothetical protein